MRSRSSGLLERNFTPVDALALARWQFAIVTVYHFLFVPVTIGMSALVAGLQTAWLRTGKEKYLRLTKFYGKIFLINIAMGIVTGIVQEFQFGMNWSDYSRFVGDIFGAPLALEALLTFFLESTFIGLWIFGWDRLPRKVHLATIWLVALGTQLSAFFILSANSWMQHPVGYTFNGARNRAELTDIGAVFTNKVLWVTFPHQIAASFMVAGAVVLAVAGWHLVHRTGVDTAAFRTAMRMGAVTLIVAGVAVAISGDLQGKVMTEVQPMKMAAAEALYTTEKPASFSIFTVGTLDGSREVASVKLPYLLSFLATGSPTAEVRGINDLQTEYQQTYGPGDYAPNIPLAYWSFRLMIGIGMVSVLVGFCALWLTRRGRVPTASARWFSRVLILTPLLPLAGNSFGWIFTEAGRQPWVVFGLMQTSAGVSPTVSAGEVWTSMIALTLAYAVLAVIEVKLLLAAAAKGLDPEAVAAGPDDGNGSEPEMADGPPLSFAY